MFSLSLWYNGASESHSVVSNYTVHEILQARRLEWVAFPFSRGTSQPRDWTQVSCIAGWFFTSWTTRGAQYTSLKSCSRREVGALGPIRVGASAERAWLPSLHLNRWRLAALSTLPFGGSSSRWAMASKPQPFWLAAPHAPHHLRAHPCKCGCWGCPGETLLLFSRSETLLPAPGRVWHLLWVNACPPALLRPLLLCLILQVLGFEVASLKSYFVKFINFFLWLSKSC